MASIKARLTISYLAITALTLLLTGGVFLVLAGSYAERLNRDSLLSAAADLLPLATDLMRADGSFPIEIPKSSELQRRLEQEGINLRFSGPILMPPPQRRTLPRPEASPDPEGGPPPGRPFIRQLRALNRLPGLNPVPPVTQEGADLLLRVPIRPPTPDTRLAVVAEFRRPATAFSGLVEQAAIGFLVAGFSALVIAGISGLVAARFMARPIARLGDRVREYQLGESLTELSFPAPREIRDLAKQFGELTLRLSASYQSLAQERDTLKIFLTDASHELRSPLTALRTDAETLAGPAGGDPKRRATSLARISGQIDRLEQVVNQLLTLTRLDGGIWQPRISPYDPAQLIARAAEDLGLDDGPLSLSLVSRLSADTQVLVDEEAAIRVFRNLLDNARKYGAQSLTADLSLEGEATVVLTLTDDGTGIFPEDLPRIGERFFRGRQSDGAVSHQDGLGIGLAMAQGLVRSMGGSLSLQSPPPDKTHGTLVTISLPKAP